MKDIFFIQYFRNIDTPYQVIKNSMFLKDAGGNNKRISHKLILGRISDYLECDGNSDDTTDITLKKLDNYYKTLTPGYISLKETTREFIISALKFVRIKLFNRNVYLYPIAPDVCLTWTELDKKGGFYPMTISKDELVIKINKCVIKEAEKSKFNCKVYGEHSEIEQLAEMDIE